MKRLALWAIGLILIATNALSQNNTYNMVITMANGTTISIGPNEVKDITFNDGEIQVTGQTLEQVLGQIGTNRIRIDSLSWVTDNLRNEYLTRINDAYGEMSLYRNELAMVNTQLQYRIDEVNMNLSDQINQLKEAIAILSARLQALEDGAFQQGGTTAAEPVAVDLGLPSGTKWADRNVGASSPEDYGGYYAWGEIEEKEAYNWSTYKWCNGTNDSQTKYCTISSYGTVDNKTVLDPEDDVAHVKWGGGWKMPTLDQVKELLDNCTSEWTTQNGVNGRRFTGPNGNSIFLPAAGRRYNSDLDDAGSVGYYWSSALDESDPFYACNLDFGSGSARWDYYGRGFGRSVRPVR